MLSLFNVISVRDDSLIEWDGKPISEATLQAYLKVTSGMNPVPVTQIKSRQRQIARPSGAYVV